MAIKIDAESAQRKEYYWIDPNEVAADQSKNGRFIKHSADSINELVESYEFEGQGQLQPVLVRKTSAGKVELIAGYRRHAAMVEYNNRHSEMPMKLRCIFIDVNDEEALIKNITENSERKGTSAIDDAHNIRRLIDVHGWTADKVAKLYRVSPASISQKKKLCRLATSIKIKVHNGEISFNEALELAGMEEAEQLKIIGGEPVELAGDALETIPDQPIAEPEVVDLKKKIREKKIADGKGKSRSVKEIKEFFYSLIGDANECCQIAKVVFAFCEGTVSDENAKEALNNLVAKQVRKL